jgi:hypothetical protein
VVVVVLNLVDLVVVQILTRTLAVLEFPDKDSMVDEDIKKITGTVVVVVVALVAAVKMAEVHMVEPVEAAVDGLVIT